MLNVSPLRDSSGVSRAQGYWLLKRAWAQIEGGGPNSKRGLLAWSVQTLMAAAGQAKEQGNPDVVVACIRQLDWLVGMGLNSAAGHRGHRSRL